MIHQWDIWKTQRLKDNFIFHNDLFHTALLSITVP